MITLRNHCPDLNARRSSCGALVPPSSASFAPHRGQSTCLAPYPAQIWTSGRNIWCGTHRPACRRTHGLPGAQAVKGQSAARQPCSGVLRSSSSQLAIGEAPPPPQVARAKSIKNPLLWIANAADERAPLPRARAMFDHFQGMDKVLKVLPGGRGAMSCSDFDAQLSWLLDKVAHSR